MAGQLCRYVGAVEEPARPFQPMNANFGLLPALGDPPRDKRERNAAYATRSLADLDTWIATLDT
jgi:methylenetetrahydrofolate--tRNA-(uracil-5-)-methyltransferase